MRYFWGALILALALSLNGCAALREGENRKITAWGIWAVVMGAPIGIGYWHSERGPDVDSEQSAKPAIPKTAFSPAFGINAPVFSTRP